MAELARMGDEERKTYNRDMTTARDTYNQIVYAKEQGLEEGRKEGERNGLEKGRKEGEKKGREEGEKKGKMEIARRMLVKGMDVDSIAELTELTSQEIAAMKEPKVSE